VVNKKIIIGFSLNETETTKKTSFNILYVVIISENYISNYFENILNLLIFSNNNSSGK
jgi:hypothetical protein